MISYIRLENFKSFSSITLDLRGSKGVPKKMAVIYGENGSGKSNLLLSMLFIQQTFETMQMQLAMQNSKLPNLSDFSEDDIPEEFYSFLKALRSRFYTLPELIQRYWAVDNTEPMSIEIGFYLNGKNGRYIVQFSADAVIEEELYYVLNERIGEVFRITAEGVNLSPSAFTDPKYRYEIEELIEKYWGKHTLMSVLYGELRSKNDAYMQRRLSGNFNLILTMFNRVSALHKGGNQETAHIAVPFRFLQRLDRGSVKSKKDKELRAFEKALNEFFTQLYSDIKSVHYSFKEIKDGYHYELYFDKICGSKMRSIPVSMESTGTKKLLDIFPLLFSCALGTSVFVDEIDTGIHDLLMQEAMSVFQQSLDEREECQFVATTHNTLLLESLEPESVYVIKSKINGEKEIVCVKEYGFRTQKNNSIRRKYLQGSYEGIPVMGYLDFGELVDEAVFEVKKHSKKKGEI